MEKQIERKFYWRKLDDQAKVFALASNRKYSSVFRLSVVLKEDIQPEILQKAVNRGRNVKLHWNLSLLRILVCWGSRM